jgi:hypothetical protein
MTRRRCDARASSVIASFPLEIDGQGRALGPSIYLRDSLGTRFQRKTKRDKGLAIFSLARSGYSRVPLRIVYVYCPDAAVPT